MKVIKGIKYLSTTDLGKVLGISRIAVFKRIQKGQIQALKVGRSYVINENDLPLILNQTLQKADKKKIEAAVQKTVDDYGETLRLLGKE